ncbi:RAS2 protein [Saxophila tyrrhenica]|uniref:RAS2 protein n=1 Tax=Saxophila tyrrhenica TaxID=1690608 RepID=A0AAV9P665_9PEZI|nr:RAS2 protein [Saxophila tyrrhenica]
MREVSTEEGAAVAKELDCMFIETSAKDGTNVEQAFCDPVRRLIELHKQILEPPKENELAPKETAGVRKSSFWDKLRRRFSHERNDDR